MHRLITLTLCVALLAACATTAPDGTPLTSQEKFIQNTESLLLFASIGAGFLTDPETQVKAQATIRVAREALELYKTAVAEGATNQEELAENITKLLQAVADLSAVGKQAAESSTSWASSTRN